MPFARPRDKSTMKMLYENIQEATFMLFVFQIGLTLGMMTSYMQEEQQRQRLEEGIKLKILVSLLPMCVVAAFR